MNDWTELSHALDGITASGTAEIREDGEWLAELAAPHCELHLQGKNPLVHLWSDKRNLTRRVLRVRERSEDRVVLEVQRFGRATPSRLEVVRAQSPRPAKRVTREQFCAGFTRTLAECFPDATIESLTASPDLENSFSGVYARGCMQEGSRAWAVMAVAPGESTAAMEGILAFGVLWLDWLRGHGDVRAILGLRLFVPEGAGSCVRERCAALSSSAGVEIFEFRAVDGRMLKMDCADIGNLKSFLVPRGEAESARAAARDAVRRIHALALHMPPAGNEIGFRVVPGTSEVSIGFRGLTFGTWSSRDGISFGLGDSREKLTSSGEPALDELMRTLDLRRGPLANDTRHSLYRAAPERWLEASVLDDPTRLDAQLDPRHLYSQVPAVTAGDRGVLDLLGVTRRGRLVVIELKASEDIQLPIQAMDYWLRVCRHQREGDFHRYGYFAGIELDPKPPLIWIAAPGLRFHSATDILLKYVSPEIRITRIGLNENWRRGLKVIFRQ
ncbi:MAG TPA: hypothetical protein VGR97_04655 [Candidatus Acidoferrales bacterium]|nr:hypothetical protein [Candidatus Acidoferrales bacterium]